MCSKARQIASLALIAILCLYIASPCRAQLAPPSKLQPIKVVSLIQDVAGNFVLLNLDSKKLLPFPTVRYFPGPSGQAIMAADFPGVRFTQPNAILPMADSEVSLVRVGQIQLNPPVMRIALLAPTYSHFRKVDFNSTPGTLIVKLPPSEHFPPERAPRAEQSAQSYALPPSSAPRPATSELRPSLPEMRPDVPAGVNSMPKPAPDFLRNKITSAPPVLRPAPDVTYTRLPAKSEAPSSAATKAADWQDQPKPAKKVSKPQEEPKASASAEGSDEKPRNKTWWQRLRTHLLSDAEPDETAAQPAKEKLPKPAPSIATKAAPGFVGPPLPPLRDATKSGAPAKIAPNAPPLAPPIVKQGSDGSAGQQESSDQVSVAITSVSPLQIAISTVNKFEYKTFRLPDPPRYIVDITGLSNPNVALPELPLDCPVKAIRTGTPDEEGKVLRVVLDLAGENIDFSQQSTPEQNSLTLATGKVLPRGPVAIPPGAVVVVDAGHGGSDPGAQRGDVQEKELTLSIAERVKRRLEGKGIRIVMTRSDDTFVSLEDRVRVTNNLSPHAFLSVHINSLETNNSIKGIETYYQNDRSKDFADVIHSSLVNNLGVPDRSVRKARFYVINHTPVPAVLAEVGFISNKEERDKLISSDYQNQIADALSEGVILFLSGQKDAIAAGTNKTAVASTTAKSFTQNLQSEQRGQDKPKAAESAKHKTSRQKQAKERAPYRVANRQIKFKKRARLAARRS